MIDKQKLVEQIIQQLSDYAANLSKAAQTAHKDATGEESKAENKYDTRGLEASYLAESQANMAAEAIQNVSSYKTIELKEFPSDSKIELTALIELEAEDGAKSFYFLGPNSGGTEIECENKKILLITPSSPIGMKLLRREKGDIITTKINGNKKEYEIINIW